jgi:para-nitrobenzyl esterase
VYAYHGNRYARARRFAPPEPVDYDPGAILGRFGPAAWQPDRPLARREFGPRPEMSEDCLYLNVWAPGGDDLPVMVWLHGGGFTVGFANALDGDRLSAEGIVVVTLNYRLGSLGWLGGGNHGLLDVVEALRWVRRHIAAFGGDPQSVTLAGQSAGALIAYDLMVDPRGDGLFHRAILESPPMFDASQPAERAQRWAAEMGDLDGLTAEQIVDRHEQLVKQPQWVATRGGALPTGIDGPERDIPVLTGVNEDEGAFFGDQVVGDRIVESWKTWVDGRPNTITYNARGTHGAEIPRVFDGDLTRHWAEFVKTGGVPDLELDVVL